MSEKKNIDRLFQEKFKDFEANPPEFVWDNIQEALHEKKKRRIVPLWLRLGGIAAALIIGFLLLQPYDFKDDKGPEQQVVTDENNTNPQVAPNVMPGQKPLQPNRHIKEDREATDINSAIVSQDGEEGSSNGNRYGVSGNTTTTNVQPHGSNNTGVANTKSNQNQNSGTKTAKHYNAGGQLQPDAVIAHNKADKNYRNDNANSPDVTNKGIERDYTKILNEEQSSNPANVVTNKERLNNSNNADVNKSNDDAGRNTIVKDKNSEAIAEQAVDTTSAKPMNELEKLLQEKLNKDNKEDEVIAEGNQDKWDIKPQIAPVFYNSLSQGSPIDAQLAANAKSYENTLSYGVGVNYALNKRLSIRSGINTVNLNYATQDIEFYASLNQYNPNVAAKSSNANIIVQPANQAPPSASPSYPTGFVNLFADQLPQEKFEGSMVQKTGYIEVPVEMSYALLNKKFGIDVIGGVSTLFLNDNNVSVISSQGYSTNVGEAQNLNNIHFSANVGLGFEYRFFKAFKASFEPMFKYQVNTFSRDTGNFKPYYIGLYSGVSFSF